jgi:hypothetical protein
MPCHTRKARTAHRTCIESSTVFNVIAAALAVEGGLRGWCEVFYILKHEVQAGRGGADTIGP